MDNTHIPNCGCDICQAAIEGKSISQAKNESFKRSLDYFEKYGWYGHYVSEPGDGMVNCHTHGLEDDGLRDLQIVAPIPPKMALSIFRTAIERMKTTERHRWLEEADNIIKDYSVQFIEATESGRDVIRIIFPDREGRFDTESSEIQRTVQT